MTEAYVQWCVDRFRVASLGRSNTAGMLRCIAFALPPSSGIRAACEALPAASGAVEPSWAVHRLEELLVALHVHGAGPLMDLELAVTALNAFSSQHGVVPAYCDAGQLRARSRYVLWQLSR